MKNKIHPKYFDEAKVHCVCGNNFTTGSTKEFIETEVCSKCHPFFTGKEKIIDALGRVEKFRKRLELKKEPNKRKKEMKQKKDETKSVTEKKEKK